MKAQQTLHALIIDRDPRTLDAMSLLLGTWGYRAYTARSTAEARDLVESDGVRPHIILADHDDRSSVSVMDTIAAVRAACGSLIPALVLCADTALLERTESGTDVPVLEKPVTPSRLREVIAALRRAAP